MNGVMGTETNWLRTALIGRNPRNTLVRIVMMVAASIIIFKFLLLPIRVSGASMLPTYQENRVNFVNRLPYVFHEPRRGDVVAIRMAGTKVMLMKRVVGLPGETVSFHEGRVYINGERLDESYVKFPSNWESGARTLGANEYYVVGDNRSMNREDHTEGVADRRRIVGKILL